MADLASVFLDRADPRWLAGAPPVADLEARLRALVDRGRSAWPTLPVDEGEFVRHLAERVTRGEAPAGELPAFHAEDLYLAYACSVGNAAALTSFEREHITHVARFVARTDPAPEFADEVAQRLREKLFVGTSAGGAKIGDYDGRGPLGGWVRVAAIRVALNLRAERGKRAARLQDVAVEALPISADPDLAYLRQRYRSEFQSALDDALASLDPDQRNLLRLQLVDGLGIDEIGPMFRIHRATAARRLERAREAVRDAMSALLRARLNLPAAELESLLGLVRSQLDVSLRQVLARGSD